MRLVFGLHFTLEHSIEFDLFLLSYECDAMFHKIFSIFAMLLKIFFFSFYLYFVKSLDCAFFPLLFLDFYHKSKISCWSHAYAQLLDIIC